MNKIYKSINVIIVIFIFSSFQLFAQNAVKEWRTYLSYTYIKSVAKAGDKIYFAPTSGLAYYDLSDGTSNILTKSSGLSDLDIAALSYSNEFKTLVIGYKNTNIDLIKDKTITNISDIFDKDILGNKVINNIHINGKYAFLCTGIGIVVLNLEKQEITDTYKIVADNVQLNIFDLANDDSFFYAATDQGIYKGEISNEFLSDSKSWVKITDIPYNNGIFSNIIIYNGTLFASLQLVGLGLPSDEIYYYDRNNNSWVQFQSDEVYGLINKLKVYDGKLMVVANSQIRVYDHNLTLTESAWPYGWTQPLDAILDNGTFYIGTTLSGFVKCNNNSTNIVFLSPDGPIANSVFNMTTYKDQLWVASGGYSITWANQYIKYGVFSLINNKWNDYGPYFKVEFPGYDYVCVAVSPSNPQNVFIGTYGFGVIELENGVIKEVYNDSNSTLTGRNNGAGYVCVTGLGFDSKGNLWVANSQATNALHVRRPNGQWEAFDLGSSFSYATTGNIYINKNNDQIWMITRTDNSILVAMEDAKNGVIGKELNQFTGNGALPGRVYSLAFDNNGEAWLGTNDGIGIITNPNNIFKGGNYDVKRVVYDGRYLFENTLISAISVDGENKKWIGTDRSGVYLMSADGQEQIYAFTSENSPLLSNNIVAMAINYDGNVFFGTDKGIISFKDNTMPITPGEDLGDLDIYPNPVYPDYTGEIAIDNVPANGSVKITDSGGRLVYSKKAQGSRAVWDGHDLRGQKVGTGVYFIYVVGEDFKQKAKGKIIFIN